MLIKNPLFGLIATGWRFAGKLRPVVIVYLIMFALAQAINLAEPMVIGKLINAVQKSATQGFKDHQALIGEINTCLFWYFLIQIGFWAFHGPGRVIERYVAFHMKVNYKGHMFAMVTRMPLQWHRGHHSGDSIDKINRASNSMCEFFDNTFETCYMLFRLIGALIILFWFMPAAGGTAIAVSAIAFLAISRFDKVLYKNYQSLNKFDNKIAAAVHDYVTNIISIITLRLEKRVQGEVDRRMRAPLPLFNTTNYINETKWCMVTVLIGVMTVLVLAHYTHSSLLAGQALMAGTFFTLYEYLRRIGDSFYNFAYIYGAVVRQSADVESAAPLFEDYERIDSKHDCSLPASWKRVDVRGLNFVYEDEKHKEHHLENVAIKLERGTSIAFVGESGSGKSTLLNLLRGMQFAEAEVECDGKRLPLGLHHLAESTTLMPQDPEIFADTIRFNITFGLQAAEDELERAIRLARFEQVLARLPDGLETNIAEKGVNLSGGEKQRLALARGLFFAKDSDIVLLDEPTSSVDQQNERQIYRNVLSTFHEKCVISSVHKLHLLEFFDYVYVFDDGKIVESGEVHTLLQGDGRLAELWRSLDMSGIFDQPPLHLGEDHYNGRVRHLFSADHKERAEIRQTDNLKEGPHA